MFSILNLFNLSQMVVWKQSCVLSLSLSVIFTQFWSNLVTFSKAISWKGQLTCPKFHMKVNSDRWHRLEELSTVRACKCWETPQKPKALRYTCCQAKCQTGCLLQPHWTHTNSHFSVLGKEEEDWSIDQNVTSEKKEMSIYITEYVSGYITLDLMYDLSRVCKWMLLV